MRGFTTALLALMALASTAADSQAQTTRPPQELGVGVTWLVPRGGGDYVNDQMTEPTALVRFTMPFARNFAVEGLFSIGQQDEETRRRTEGLYGSGSAFTATDTTTGDTGRRAVADVGDDAARIFLLDRHVGGVGRLLHELTRQQRQHRVTIPKRLDTGRILAAREFITQHAGLELADFVLVEIAHVVPDQLWRRFRCRPHAVPLQGSEHIGAIPEGGHEPYQESSVRRTASNVALIFNTCRGWASASASGFGVSIACPRIGSTISLNFAG